MGTLGPYVNNRLQPPTGARIWIKGKSFLRIHTIDNHLTWQHDSSLVLPEVLYIFQYRLHFLLLSQLCLLQQLLPVTASGSLFSPVQNLTLGCHLNTTQLTDPEQN